MNAGVNIYEYVSANPPTSVDRTGTTDKNIADELSSIQLEQGVSDRIIRHLNAEKIPWAKEVMFYVLDDEGNRMTYPEGHRLAGKPVRGRTDLMTRVGEELTHIEVKLDPNSSVTDGQPYYQKLLREGATIEVVAKSQNPANELAKIGLRDGDAITVRFERYDKTDLAEVFPRGFEGLKARAAAIANSGKRVFTGAGLTSAVRQLSLKFPGSAYAFGPMVFDLYTVGSDYVFEEELKARYHIQGKANPTVEERQWMYDQFGLYPIADDTGAVNYWRFDLTTHAGSAEWIKEGMRTLGDLMDPNSPINQNVLNGEPIQETLVY